jgi:hypothetical protein
MACAASTAVTASQTSRGSEATRIDGWTGTKDDGATLILISSMMRISSATSAAQTLPARSMHEP